MLDDILGVEVLVMLSCESEEWVIIIELIFDKV